MTTEQRIIKAFLNLIQQHPFNEISTAEIMRQAGVTRTYFYRFFDDKVDLAREAFFSLIEDMLENLTQLFKQPNSFVESHTLAAITMIFERKNDMQALLAVQSADFNLSAEFQDRIKQIIKADLVRYQQTPVVTLDYFAELFAASAITTIRWILNTSADITADQVVQYIDTSVYSGMIALLTPEP